MKLWTTQTKEVIKILLEKGEYNPDFSKPKELGSENMSLAYSLLLKEYNKRNSTLAKGLIYCVSKLDDSPIEGLDDYRDYFRKNPFYWDSVSAASEKYALLELEIDEELDTIPIYLQDFIILAERAIQKDEYLYYIKDSLKSKPYSTFEDDLEIAQKIGWTNDIPDILGEVLLHKIVQAHVHKIKLRDIVGVYPTINYENGLEYNLCLEAQQLKTKVDSNNG